MEEIRKAARETLRFIARKLVYPLLYRWYARKPIDEKLVLFADLRSATMPDNFEALYKKCGEDGYHCEIVLVPQYVTAESYIKRHAQALKCTFAFLKIWARCRVLFLTDYFPLAYTAHVRSETKVIQLWHACGAMKMFGYSTAKKAWGQSEKEVMRYPFHINYTLACVSGPKAVEPFTDAFHSKPGVVQAMGLPRTDVYFDAAFREKAVRKVRAEYPEIGGRKIILYAPTFRGNSMKESHLDLNLDFRALGEALAGEYALLLKLHPLMEQKEIPAQMREAFPGFVINVTDRLSAAEALCAADVLVTDYSSIAFEYLLLERPIVSYIYDLEEYIADRGLYYPYEELLPGPYVYDQAELTEKLKTVETWFDPERTREYREAFMSACDGHSTDRIYAYVFGETQDGGRG